MRHWQAFEWDATSRSGGTRMDPKKEMLAIASFMMLSDYHFE